MHVLYRVMATCLDKFVSWMAIMSGHILCPGFKKHILYRLFHIIAYRSDRIAFLRLLEATTAVLTVLLDHYPVSVVSCAKFRWPSLVQRPPQTYEYNDDVM